MKYQNSVENFLFSLGTFCFVAALWFFIQYKSYFYADDFMFMGIASGADFINYLAQPIYNHYVPGMKVLFKAIALSFPSYIVPNMLQSILGASISTLFCYMLIKLGVNKFYSMLFSIIISLSTFYAPGYGWLSAGMSMFFGTFLFMLAIAINESKIKSNFLKALLSSLLIIISVSFWEAFSAYLLLLPLISLSFSGATSLREVFDYFKSSWKNYLYYSIFSIAFLLFYFYTIIPRGINYGTTQIGNFEAIIFSVKFLLFLSLPVLFGHPFEATSATYNAPYYNAVIENNFYFYLPFLISIFYFSIGVINKSTRIIFLIYSAYSILLIYIVAKARYSLFGDALLSDIRYLFPLAPLSLLIIFSCIRAYYANRSKLTLTLFVLANLSACLMFISSLKILKYNEISVSKEIISNAIASISSLSKDKTILDSQSIMPIGVPWNTYKTLLAPIRAREEWSRGANENFYILNKEGYATQASLRDVLSPSKIDCLYLSFDRNPAPKDVVLRAVSFLVFSDKQQYLDIQISNEFLQNYLIFPGINRINFQTFGGVDIIKIVRKEGDARQLPCIVGAKAFVAE